jgi:5-methylcytosine-specific restriction endonuclease McrA
MRPCVYCSTMFEAKNKLHAYCSHACKRAVRGSVWRKARALALFRDGYQCTDCRTTEELEVHHLKPLCEGGSHATDNLTTLCHADHVQAHRELRKKKEDYGREREKEACRAA